MKKILALALVLTMVLSMFNLSFVASAEETSATPEGTPLYSEEDLLTLERGKAYYLANDIDLSGDTTIELPAGVTIDGNGFGFIKSNGELTVPLFSFERVQVEQPVVDPDSGEPLYDEFTGDPLMETVTLDYETPTTFQNIYFGKKGAFIKLPTNGSYNTANNLSAPVFEANPTLSKIDWNNVSFSISVAGTTTAAYIPTLFWNLKGVQNFNNCALTLSAQGIKGVLGGFAINTNGTVTMTDCTAGGKIVSSKDAGGFVKEVSAGSLTLTNCVNNMVIDADGLAGGFISSARADLFVYNCVNNAALDLGAHAGALFGNIQKASKLYVDGFVNNGEVKGTAHLGGIMGAIWATKVDGHMNTIKNVTNNATITATASGGYTGGIVGDNGKTPAIFENVVNNGTVTGQTRHIAGFIGRNAQDNGSSDFLDDVLLFKNCVNNGNVYKTGSDGNEASGFVAIQAATTASHVLRMVFENCVNNGNIDAVHSRTAAGFVGCTDFINVHPEASMTFINCTNNGDMIGGTLGAGGFVGYSQDSMYFENCVNTGDVTNGKSGTGGLCGLTSWRANASNILKDYADRLAEMGVKTGAGVKAYNCINTGKITSTANIPTGGLFGQINSAVTVVIDNCANYGTVSGGNDAAGILANHKDGELTISNCVNYGDISGNQIVGGIVGWKTAGNATVTNVANYGDVKGCHGVGGIMGEIVSGTLDKALNAGNVGPFSSNAEGIGGIVGIFRNVTNAITISNVANIGTVTGTTKANETYGCFTEGFGQLIGRVGGGSNGNDPFIADGGLVDGVYTFDNGDAIAPACKLVNALAYGAAQVNPDAQWAPSEVVLGYKAGTSTPIYTMTESEALPVVRNNGAFGDNVKVAEGSTYEVGSDLAKLEAMGFAANFKVVDGKIVVDTDATLKGYQLSKDGTAIRFAATIDNADADTFGFVFTLKYNDKVVADNVAADVEGLLYAVKANGISTELAAVNGGKLFSTITFENIPAAGKLEITVQATVNGVATGKVATVTFVDGAIQ